MLHKRIRNIVVASAVAVSLLSGCSDIPSASVPSGRLPQIWPDYTGVTIPAGIAPLDFDIAGEPYESMAVDVRGSRGGRITASGDHADFDIDDWHELTWQNRGGQLNVTVYVKRHGSWTRYKAFPIYVSNYRLDAWGLTYRLIDPGYEVGGDIGLYQRELATFDETPLLTEKTVPGRCMNCHTPNRTDPDEYTMQVRGGNGGTLISRKGHDEWLDTKTDSTRAAGSYAYWHPQGRYVAYAANSVHQSFFTGRGQNIEVFHLFSNIILLDTYKRELVLDKRLVGPDDDIFPAFSPDGRTLYYSSSRHQNLPEEYKKVKCSLVALPFDVRTGCFGQHADTLLNGRRDNRSYLMPRPSYDGRWIMLSVASRSNFTIAQKDADLWLYDVRSRSARPLSEVNSRSTESYHNWSRDSHWFVFASKRGDGVHTRLYLSCLDKNGKATKPFLLPQRRPWQYYHAQFKAYNVPDFTVKPVKTDMRRLGRDIMGGARTKVSIRGAGS